MTELPYKLTAGYDGRITRYEWTKDGESIDAKSQKIQVNSREIILPTEISQSLTGVYRLRLFVSSILKIVEDFYFDLLVVGRPILINDYSDNHYVEYGLVNKSRKVSHEIKGEKIKLTLLLDDESVPFNNLNSDSLTINEPQFQLKLSIRRLEFTNKIAYHFVYHRTYLKYNWIDLIFRNGLGESRIRTLLYPVDIPTPITNLNTNSCIENCLSSEYHYFQAKIYRYIYAITDIDIKYYWFVNKNPLESLLNSNKTMSKLVLQEGDMLILKPTTNKSEIKSITSLFHNATITCAIQLFVEKSKDSSPQIIFDSRTPSDSIDFGQSLIQIQDSSIENHKDNLSSDAFKWILVAFSGILSLAVILYACFVQKTSPKDTFYNDSNSKSPKSDSFMSTNTGYQCYPLNVDGTYYLDMDQLPPKENVYVVLNPENPYYNDPACNIDIFKCSNNSKSPLKNSQFEFSQ